MEKKLDLSELMSFKKNELKKRKTNEKNSLPDKKVMKEEKKQLDNSPSNATKK